MVSEKKAFKKLSKEYIKNVFGGKIMVSEKKASAVLKGFAQEYHLAEPYNQYVAGVGIQSKINDGRKHGKLEELCLVAYLKKPLPSNIKLPLDYKSMKVYTEYIGTVKPE